MVTCPKCGYYFEPKYLDVEDDIAMVTLQCPSCKCLFSRNIEYLTKKEYQKIKKASKKREKIE